MSLPTDYGLPPDAVALVTVCAAFVLVAFGAKMLGPLLSTRRRWVVLLSIAVGATALSAGYVAYYLRGGPRIIDATSYWLEARALARGLVTWPIEEPTASLRGRFLLLSGSDGAWREGVIFPPGYPALLAIGFLLRAPLWVGPFVAGLLAIATHELARRVTGRGDVARIAALLSLVCAALRYHTADTMSHGWAALLVASSLALAHDARERRGPFHAGAAGLLYGWLFATRPVTAIALAPVLLAVLHRARARERAVAALALAVPVTLLLLEQRVVTGAWLTSSQAAYYAVADGPPGCFRLGLGGPIGCLHEHGEYVRALFPNGFGLGALALTTLRRLRLHLIDIANAEPLALLVPIGVWLGRRDRLASWLGAGVLFVVLGYAPFYFDGSYPGGGARLYADILPLEHVLVAMGVVGLADLARRRGWPWLTVARATALTLALSMLGFGLHAAYLHRKLAEREGGRPYYEPSFLAAAGIDHGLVFTGTDHAFNLAFDPAARDPRREIVVAREHGDDRDRLLWEKYGRPPSYRYAWGGTSDRPPAVVPWSPMPFSLPYRYEAEAEWPPILQRQGYLEPMYATGTCAWGGRVLTARPEPGHAMYALIGFPTPFAGRFSVSVHLAAKGRVVARVALLRALDAPPVASWGFTSQTTELRCAALRPAMADLGTHGYIEIEASGDELSLDAVAVEPDRAVGSE